MRKTSSKKSSLQFYITDSLTNPKYIVNISYINCLPTSWVLDMLNVLTGTINDPHNTQNNIRTIYFMYGAEFINIRKGQKHIAFGDKINIPIQITRLEFNTINDVIIETLKKSDKLIHSEKLDNAICDFKEYTNESKENNESSDEFYLSVESKDIEIDFEAIKGIPVKTILSACTCSQQKKRKTGQPGNCIDIKILYGIRYRNILDVTGKKESTTILKIKIDLAQIGNKNINEIILEEIAKREKTEKDPEILLAFKIFKRRYSVHQGNKIEQSQDQEPQSDSRTTLPEGKGGLKLVLEQ